MSVCFEIHASQIHSKSVDYVLTYKVMDLDVNRFPLVMQNNILFNLICELRDIDGKVTCYFTVILFQAELGQ